MNYDKIREHVFEKYALYVTLTTRAYQLVHKSTWGSERYQKAWRMAEYFRGQSRALSYCLHTIDLRIKAQREQTL